MSQKERDALKPCPFCGEKAELRTEGKQWIVRCTSCWGQGGPQYDSENAVSLWNEREYHLARRYPDETPAPTGQKVDADTGEAMAAIKQLQAEYGKPAPPEAVRRWKYQCNNILCEITHESKNYFKVFGTCHVCKSGQMCLVEDTGSGGETPA
jgi:hypothetical protein